MWSSLGERERLRICEKKVDTLPASDPERRWETTEETCQRSSGHQSWFGDQRISLSAKSILTSERKDNLPEWRAGWELDRELQTQNSDAKQSFPSDSMYMKVKNRLN